MLVDPARVAGLFAVALAVIAVPGPSVLLVVSRGVAQGRAAALATVAGTEIGLAVQVGAVAFGLGAIVERSIAVYTCGKRHDHDRPRCAARSLRPPGLTGCARHGAAWIAPHRRSAPNIACSARSEGVPRYGEPVSASWSFDERRRMALLQRDLIGSPRSPAARRNA